MSKQIEWTTTEQPEPVTRAWRLRVFRTDGDNWAGRDATEADLLAAGYVPQGKLYAVEEAAKDLDRDLRAARERTEQLERELAQERDARAVEREALEADMYGAINERDESRARLAAYIEATGKLLKTAIRANNTVTSVNTVELDALENLWRSDALDATHPTPPEAVDPDKVKREPGCQCHWEVGDSPCRVHGENEEGPTPPEAKGDERAEDYHLAKAREWLDGLDMAGTSRNDFRFAQSLLRILAHLESHRSPAPSKPGAVKPSEASPLPWSFVPLDDTDQHAFLVVDARECEVCAVDAEQDAAFIVALANKWHAEQGGEGE